MYRYILASASPRRSELLAQVGIRFQIIKSDIEEIITNVEPDQVVIELSRQKAQDVYNNLADKKNVVVIGADTIVYYDNGILGKPKDDEDAFKMLAILSGRSHYVYTGVTLNMNGEIISFAEKTRVDVYSMTQNEINAYIKTKEPIDKAGAYAIQGLFAAYIKGIEGDYNNVVGLPIGRICQELKTRKVKYEYEI